MSRKILTRGLAAAVGLLLAFAWMQIPVSGEQLSSTDIDTRTLAAALFAIDADRITVTSPAGSPPVIRVERDGTLVGYLASTSSIIGSVGYSGKPIDVMIAVDKSATIRGARLVSQSEPILTIGISERDIAAYVDGFRDISLGSALPVNGSAAMPDAIAGATISSGVIRDGIIRTARTIALAYGLLDNGTARHIDRTNFVAMDWAQLVAIGAMKRRLVTLGDVRQALDDPKFNEAAGDPNGTFSELYYGLLTPAKIGQNLLGKRIYTALMSKSGVNDHSILVAANGLYSFKGTRWRKSGIFERLELHQENRTIRLTRDGYQNIEKLSAAGAPSFREVAAFKVPAVSGFDPTRPWRLSLLVRHETDIGVDLSTAFPLHYQLSDQFTLGAASTDFVTAEQPLWQQNWRARIPDIVIVCLMLLVLAVILIFQDLLAPRIRLYHIVRVGFLTATLLVLGWWLGAQLSVVQVLAFTQAIQSGFHWETFLLDPLIFILWSAVAVSLLFWGRGVFCGWLCPFGALQELLNMAARRLGIHQISVPFGLHERLWPIKYIFFLGLFALSLHSITDAFFFAEVEPFKTAITLKFGREWPFLVYVGILLFAGLFIERAYCRYLCPLGAALAIPARLRMFEWLKRRPQCGRECRICAVRCTVQAIHPNGQINPNECIHCLRCQTNYFDPATCPPLKERARRRATFGPKPVPPAPTPSPSPVQRNGQ